MTTPRIVTLPGSGASAPGSSQPALDYNEFIQELGGSVNSIRGEINDAFEDMKLFHQEEPDAIMRKSGAHSARLSYIRVLCLRIEDWYRPARDLRMRELEPTITELANQYQIASRLHSVRELDWKMESGER